PPRPGGPARYRLPSRLPRPEQRSASARTPPRDALGQETLRNQQYEGFAGFWQLAIDPLIKTLPNRDRLRSGVFSLAAQCGLASLIRERAGRRRPHTMWMPPPCRKNCMKAATMLYRPGAGEAGVAEVPLRCARGRWPVTSGPRST